MSWVHAVAICTISLISSVSQGAFPRAPERFDDELLPVILRNGDEQHMRLSRLTCEAGEVVLLHKLKGHAIALEDLKTQVLTESGLQTARFKSLEKFLNYLEAKIVDDPTSVWTADATGKSQRASEPIREGNPRYNCHAFALGDDIGLTPSDWVKGLDEAFVRGDRILPLPGNPMETLLASYYTEIQRHELAGKGFKLMVDREPIRLGDVVVLTGNPETTNGGFPRLQHEVSARIVSLPPTPKKDFIDYAQSIRVRVKISESMPLIEMPMSRLLMHSFGFYNEVRFYRLKK